MRVQLARHIQDLAEPTKVALMGIKKEQIEQPSPPKNQSRIILNQIRQYHLQTIEAKWRHVKSYCVKEGSPTAMLCAVLELLDSEISHDTVVDDVAKLLHRATSEILGRPVNIATSLMQSKVITGFTIPELKKIEACSDDFNNLVIAMMGGDMSDPSRIKNRRNSFNGVQLAEVDSPDLEEMLENAAIAIVTKGGVCNLYRDLAAALVLCLDFEGDVIRHNDGLHVWAVLDANGRKVKVDAWKQLVYAPELQHEEKSHQRRVIKHGRYDKRMIKNNLLLKVRQCEKIFLESNHHDVTNGREARRFILAERARPMGWGSFEQRTIEDRVRKEYEEKRLSH